MVKAKMKLLSGNYLYDLESEINEFLDTIDVRQIVKIDYNSHSNGSSNYFSCIIMFISPEDAREIKLDNILDKDK